MFTVDVIDDRNHIVSGPEARRHLFGSRFSACLQHNDQLEPPAEDFAILPLSPATFAIFQLSRLLFHRLRQFGIWRSESFRCVAADAAVGRVSPAGSMLAVIFSQRRSPWDRSALPRNPAPAGDAHVVMERLWKIEKIFHLTGAHWARLRVWSGYWRIRRRWTTRIGDRLMGRLDARRDPQNASSSS